MYCSVRAFRTNIFVALASALLLASLAPAARAQTCPFDDGNSSLEVEGLILTRYALGLTGAPLVANTGISAADAPSVEATINCPSCGLHITGNPTLTVADATIISRKLAGFAGAALTDGVNLGSGTRNTPAAVSSFLLAGCGATGGTVTSITAGTGLTGGSITTSGTISADTTFLQRRVSSTCAAGSFITAIAADGTVTCAAPPAGGSGTVTSVATGSGLTGGPITASGTIAADTAFLQRRVAATCAVGSSIRVIAVDGTVTCQTDTVGGSGTVTSITAGTGLTGGTITAAGTVGLANLGVGTAQLADASVTAAKLATNGCTGGQVLQYNGSAWVCATPAGSSGGTVTSITAGTGLTGGTITGSGTIGLGTVPVANGGTGQASLTSNGVVLGQGSNALATTAAGAAGQVLAGTAGAPVWTGSPSLSGNLTVSGSVGVGGAVVAGSTLTVAGRIESTSGGVKFPDGSVQTTAASGPDGVFNVAAPQPNTLTVVAAGFAGQYGSITVAPDGFPVISYYDNNNRDLKVAKCGNAACSAGNTITAVDTLANVGEYSSITLGADGLPVISYYDATNQALKVTKCGNAACSAGNTITFVDSGAVPVGQYSSITLGVDGFPVISYYDGTIGALKVTKCGNAACSAGNTGTAVDTTGFAGQYTSITLGADGLPVISYYDNNNADLKVAKCGNVACSAGNTLTAVDTVGTVGLHTSITLGTDGLPVISYKDNTNNDLKVAKCGNAACSAGNTITAVDTAGSVGQYTSITLGADGLPVISYYDATNADLKVAKCGNAACSAGNTITAVDTAGSVGQYTSITIGADGLPVISYFDVINQNLKVAKCASTFCTPYFRRR